MGQICLNDKADIRDSWFMYAYVQWYHSDGDTRVIMDIESTLGSVHQFEYIKHGYLYGYPLDSRVILSGDGRTEYLQPD